jgi:hypothetical protein
MSLFIRDDLNQTNHAPIDVKIKYFHNATIQKLDSAICSKCYRYFPDNKDHTRFEWWIEMNRLFGYNHIYICNNSIPNSDAYRRVFKKYERFIHIYQMNTIPDFIDPAKHVYMNNMLDLKDGGNYSKAYASVFDMVGMNECYLNNVDKYKYITVIDNDETLIPRSNRILLKQSDLYNFINSIEITDSSQTRMDLDKKLLATISSGCSMNKNQNDIMTYRGKFEQNKTLSFMMAYYLKDRTVNKILKELEIYFNTLKKISSDSNQFKVIIYDYDFTYKYQFLFQNENDVKYARNLIKLNRILVMNSTGWLKDSDFNRFFYLSGQVTSFAFGKSIHDTLITEYFSHHYPKNVRRSKLSYEYGHLAHFRESYTYAFAKNVNIPISNLQFDLNYFYCYFDRIVSSLNY